MDSCSHTLRLGEVTTRLWGIISPSSRSWPSHPCPGPSAAQLCIARPAGATSRESRPCGRFSPRSSGSFTATGPDQLWVRTSCMCRRGTGFCSCASSSTFGAGQSWGGHEDPPENGVGSGVPGRDRNAHPSMILGSPIPLSDGVSGDGVAANSGAIHVDNDRSAPNNESYFSLATLGARYYT